METGYLDHLGRRDHQEGEVTQTPGGFHRRPREGAGPLQAEIQGSLGRCAGSSLPHPKPQSPWQKWRLGQTSTSPSYALGCHRGLAWAGGLETRQMPDQNSAGLPTSLP